MVLNKDTATFKGLSMSELLAFHEVLAFLREPGNNQWITGFMTSYEIVSDLWQKLGDETAGRLQTLLPEADKRMQITFAPKFGRGVTKGELGDTLGEESVGFVQIETNTLGRPKSMKGYDHLQQLGDYEQVQRVAEVRLPTADGRTWRARPETTLDLANVAPNLCKDLATGSKFLVEKTWVQAGDAHFDAKAYPCSHPCPAVIVTYLLAIDISTFSANCAHVPKFLKGSRLVYAICFHELPCSNPPDNSLRIQIKNIIITNQPAKFRQHGMAQVRLSVNSSRVASSPPHATG